MRRLGLLVVLVAFSFSCGAQWPVLQALAWANMVREYSEMVPLGQAVKMTLSGKYPCAMCKAIAEKKNSENTKVAALFQHGTKITCASFQFRDPLRKPVSLTFAVTDKFLQTWADSPPIPPPRTA